MDILNGLALACADEVFGDELNSKEDLFLTHIIDETELMQSELVIKLNSSLELQGYSHADHYVLQAFGRKAGFNGRIDSGEELGEYVMGICLRDFQCISFERKEYFVNAGQFSPVFNVKKLGKRTIVPCIPKNKTLVKPNDGRSRVKSKNFSCLLVWAFWAEDPDNGGPNFKMDDIEKLISQLNDAHKIDEEFSESLDSDMPEGVEY